MAEINLAQVHHISVYAKFPYFELSFYGDGSEITIYFDRAKMIELITKLEDSDIIWLDQQRDEHSKHESTESS